MKPIDLFAAGQCGPRLFHCLACGTEFEENVADRDPVEGPRCPQCFLSTMRLISEEEAGDFVVRSGTPFR